MRIGLLSLLLITCQVYAQDNPSANARNEKTAKSLFKTDLESLNALIAELSSPETKIARNACNTISIRAKSADGELFSLSVKALASTLRDTRSEMREAGLQGFAELLRWRRDELDPNLFDLISRLAEDSDDKVRIAALRDVVILYGANSFNTLNTQSESKSSEVRAEALRLMGEACDQRAEPSLLRGLSDDAPAVRAAAAKALGTKQVKSAEAYLTDLLGDPNEQVRASAASALGLLQSPSAISALTERLYDPEKEVKVAAIDALGLLHAESAVDALIATLSYPDKDSLNKKISVSLSKIGDSAVDPLVSLWRNQRGAKLSGECNIIDERKRLDVVALLTLKEIKTPAATNALLQELPTAGEFQPCVYAALSERDDERALEALAVGLQNPDEKVQREVIKALMKSKTPIPAKGVAGLLNSNNELIRRDAFLWVSSNASVAVEAMPYALQTLADNNALPSERIDALEILQLIPDPKAQDAILKALDNPITDIASAAATAAANLDSPDIQKKLLNLALNPKSAARIQALRALSLRTIKHGETSGLSALAPLLNDKNFEISYLAARALSLSSEKKKYTQSLLKFFAAPEPTKAQLMSTLLVYVSPDDAFLPLMQALSSDEIGVALHAAWALGETKNKKAIEPLSKVLLAALNKEKSEVAINAAASLGMFRDASALPVLKKCLGAYNADLRSNCLLAYSRSGGDLSEVILLSKRTEREPIRIAAVQAIFERINEPNAKQTLELLSKENTRTGDFARKLLAPQAPPKPIGYTRSFPSSNNFFLLRLPDQTIKYVLSDPFGDIVEPNLPSNTQYAPQYASKPKR